MIAHGDTTTFKWFFAELGIRHFSAEEILYASGDQSTMPPAELWPNIAPTLAVADALRSVLGIPLEITSAYRSPDHNAAVGGSRRSQHLRFCALDLRIPPEQLGRAWETLMLWQSRLFLRFPLDPREMPPKRWEDLRWIAVRGEPLRWLPLELWEHPEQSPVFQFRGGLGLYDWGVHIDTRGFERVWGEGQ